MAPRINQIKEDCLMSLRSCYSDIMVIKTLYQIVKKRLI